MREFFKHVFLAMEFFGGSMLCDKGSVWPCLAPLVIGAIGYFALSEWDEWLETWHDAMDGIPLSPDRFLRFLAAALVGVGAYLPFAGRAGLGLSLVLIGVGAHYFIRRLDPD